MTVALSSEVKALRAELAELGALTETGLRRDPELSARIGALARMLECARSCEEPARASALLRGRWRLLYSDFDLERETTLARLSFNVLPREPVSIVELFQEIHPALGHYDNVVSYTDARGEPGTLVMVGAYQPVDDSRIDILFTHAVQSGPSGQVRLPIAADWIPPIQSEITYLDDGFRLHRSSLGSLYMFERMDDAPIRWAREA